MATLSGTLYALFGILASGNMGKPNASNGLQGRIQADGFALSDSKNADFSGSGTTVTFNASAIAWAALNMTGSDLDDLATSDHADMTAGIGSTTHAQIDTHVGLTNEHLDWEADSVGTIHASNYIEGGDGTDTTAIHKATASEIHTAADTAPATADEILFEDATNSWAKGRCTISDILGLGSGDAAAYHDDVANEITATAAKTTCADADEFLMEDSAASFVKKAITFDNLQKQVDHDTTTNFSIGKHRVINDAGTSTTELWSASKINTMIAAVTSGLDWQESVLDIVDNTSAPPGESTGNRYLLDDTGGGVHADWDGAAINDIVEFDGASWVVSYTASGNEGGAAWVEDVNAQYMHNGTDWVLLAAAHNHDDRYFTETEIGSTTPASEGALVVGTDSKTNLGSATTVEAAITACDTHVGAANPHSGSAASGANSDITSLTGLSTPLAAGYGGTGTAAPTEDAILVGETGGTWNLKTLANGALAYNTTTDVFAQAAIADLSDISGTTGSGSTAVLGTSPTITTPTISGDITFEEGTYDLTLAVTTQTSSAPTLTIPDLAGTSGNMVIDSFDNTLTGDNDFQGETVVDTFILGGDGASPEGFGLEIAFTVLNPSATVNEGDLLVLDSSGDVYSRTAATQIAFATARYQAVEGATVHACFGPIVPYNTADSPAIGDELFVRNETTFDTMTTTVPTAGKSMMPCIHLGSGQMLMGFWSKLWEFET